MKRNIGLSLAILATITVFSCQEEPDFALVGNEFVLTATIDPDEAVRTALSPSGEGVSKVLWSADDRIGVYVDGATEPALFRLVSGEGDVTGEFSGPLRGSRYLAVYPMGIAGKAEEGGISVTIPEEQHYVADSFAPDSYPMIASGEYGRLSFKNLCSILRVSLTGHQAVTNLEFLPNDPAAVVSGPATADLVDGIPRLTMSADGGKRVVLHTPGVLLNDETATDFYLVIPPRTYKGGFTIRIHTTGGSMDKVYGADFTMERSKLHKAAPFVLKLDQGSDTSLRLSGSGTVEDPFLIGSLSDLLLMQATVNTVNGILTAADGTAVTARSAHFLLTADIDLGSVCGSASGKSWRPVGATESTSFYGVFDGGGHTISNLFIQGENNHLGLFGFGYDYPNFFTKGIITNLNVSGYVKGTSEVGLIVGTGGDVSYCTSEGEVVSDDEAAGGIAGSVYNIVHCVNKASVRKTRGMTYSIGGIAGVVMRLCHDCRNEGDVFSDEGFEIGGIAGVTRNATVYNCVNTGTIYGGQKCGGIVGAMVGSLQNCLNEGNVSSGYGYSGGIAGVLSSESSIMNCVNIASVSEREYATSCGGICGYVFPNGAVDYGYWPGDIPAVRDSDSNHSHYCQSFSSWQWNESESGSVFFTTEKGFPCVSLIEALNGWAYEHSTKEMSLSGWAFQAETGTGTLTGNPASDPAGGDSFLRIIPSMMEAGPSGGILNLRVASSDGFRIATSPSWVHFSEERAVEGIPNNWIQSVSIDANSGDHRTGAIEFSSDKGKKASVTISQFGQNEFDWSQTFFRRSLFFVYAAPLYFFGYGSYEEAYNLAEKEFPSRILHAAISDEGTLACPQYDQMLNKNGIYGVPRLYLDGTTCLNNGSIETAAQGIIDACRNNESREAVSTAELSATLSGRHLTLDIHGRFKKKGDYTVHVMLLEDNLPYMEKTWNHMVRMVLSDETGDPFTLTEDRLVRSFTYSADIPAAYNPGRMNALVFFQAAHSGNMVDNAFCVPIH